MDGCFTCEVNAGQREPPGGTVYEDDHWLADHGTPTLVRGYIVLKPKRHVEAFADLRPDEAADFGVATQRLLGAMRIALKPERVYVCAFGRERCWPVGGVRGSRLATRRARCGNSCRPALRRRHQRVGASARVTEDLAAGSFLRCVQLRAGASTGSRKQRAPACARSCRHPQTEAARDLRDSAIVTGTAAQDAVSSERRNKTESLSSARNGDAGSRTTCTE